jgi:hypothetical protein
MPDLSAAHRQLRLLAARIAAAECAAGMTDDDIAAAARAMELRNRARMEEATGDVPENVVLAFRLSSLHIRLSNAERFRTARRKTNA